MTRTIEREYVLSKREVHEAVLAWLKIKDLHYPLYVENTANTVWLYDSAGQLTIKWTVKDEVDA